MQNVSRIGVAAISLIFEKMGFAFREQPIEDYGIDAIVEERAEKGLTGKLIGVQIKSGTSFFHERRNGKVVFRGEMKHYDYWMNYSLPVILVLYHPETGDCIYEVITSDNITKTEKGWKVEIDVNNKLENAALPLRNLTADRTEYQKRLSTLAFARGLMQLAEEEMLVVEVGEWVNKSSGRGEFRLMTVDRFGKEKTLFEKTILGFGPRLYSEVLPEVFPWAELVIDEAYYEMYGDEEYIRYMKRMDPDIYPYRNSAGEVDWYRFRPDLNDVGRSFLVLDEFLSGGRMYHVRL